MPRLFLALEIPYDATLSLSLLRGGLPGARWIDTENYHLTLRFFGDIDGHAADEIASALDRIHRPSFQLQLAGTGVFGSKKPHTLWAGIAASPDLTALQGDIERTSQRLGLSADPRKYSPHVTLARLRDVAAVEVAAWLSARGNFKTPPFSVSRFVMMSARSSIGGGPYIIEESWALMAPVASPQANFRTSDCEAAQIVR